MPQRNRFESSPAFRSGPVVSWLTTCLFTGICALAATACSGADARGEDPTAPEGAARGVTSLEAASMDLVGSSAVTAAASKVRCRKGADGIFTQPYPVYTGPAYGSTGEELKGATVVQADVYLDPTPETLANLTCLERVEGTLWIQAATIDPARPTDLRGLERLQSVTGDLIAVIFGQQGATIRGLSGVRDVGGQLVLQTPLEDVKDLKSLRSVGKDLFVYASNLESLEGLTHLERIGGTLWLDGSGVSGVKDLRGLEHLRSLGGLQLNQLPKFTSFRGLPPVETFSGELSLQNLPALTSLAGLGKLRQVDGRIFLVALPAIERLTGLDSLRSIGGQLILWDVPVSNLDPLSHLTKLGGLALLGQTGVTSLAALGNLTHIDGAVELLGITSLTSLRGLEHLESIAGGLSVSPEVPLALDGLEGLVSVGDLSIGTPNVPSLRPLGKLATITGSLTLTNTAFASLEGLENLKAIGGALWLAENAELARLDALSSVTEITGAVYVSACPKLESLHGLENLVAAGGVSLQELPALRSITALSKIGALTYDLALSHLPLLEALSGLEGVTAVDGTLSLFDLPALSSVAGLQNLTRIGGPLQLMSLPVLTNLTGFERLTSAGGLYVQDNATLQDLRGLGSLTRLTTPQLVIRNNPKLPGCEADAVATRLAMSCQCPWNTYPSCDPNCQPGGACIPCDSPYYCSCTGPCRCAGNDNSQATCN